MIWLGNLSKYIEDITSIPAEYIKLTSITLISIIAINIIKIICFKVYLGTTQDSKDRYLFNRKLQMIVNILILVAILVIWGSYIKNFITLISFISAGITISLREVIVNFFAGAYIRVNKPFVLEDRIEINNIKGDVVNINASSFDILEIGDRVNAEQSTGRIVHIPNSMVFTYPVKNYVKAFKYIWHEITVKIPIDSDVMQTKTLIYKIVKRNSIIKRTPNKMETQINSASTDYRIYFNNLDPIIYTAIVDDHIELYIRYLVHPKKVRTVEDAIWLDIIKAYKNDNIELHKGIPN